MVDPRVIAVVPLLPWVAAVSIGVGQILRRPRGMDVPSERPTLQVSLAANGISLLIMLLVAVEALFAGAPGGVRLGEWFGSGGYGVDVSFTLDTLGLAMGLMVTFVLFLTVRFSMNYMHRESGFQRYFLVLNLFAGAMSLLVLAGNGVLTFVGWELAGVSSYLLIGYMVEREIATRNANQALITNRFGDAAFLLAIFLTFNYFGSSEWAIFSSAALSPTTPGINLIAMAFLIAALAKSAQIPFSPWIARALDGPTPSSAVFYGSLMVHAGVYLTIRLEPLLQNTPGVMMVISVLGLLTALYGWVCGLVVSDVKSSLMFSTTAQVGLMFFWCGQGLFDLAAWHLALHAFWRAWQFFHAPALIFMVSRPAKPAPEWIINQSWLHTAALQRFWLEQIGHILISRPTARLAADVDAFEKNTVNPTMGMPGQVNAISSVVQWEERKTAQGNLTEDGVSHGKGIFSQMIHLLAMLLKRFEEKIVLRGGGEGLTHTLRRIGDRLIRIDQLLSEPRYLLLLIAITFVIIL
ncbi:MAG: hypothetical protein HQL52_08125 [Magnetococcales bacterium]|nr:hypothetical protein [Magnetococcales bacterium]